MNYRIPLARPDIGEEELKNVTECVNSGWVSSRGPFIRKFEEEFSDYVGMKYGVATSNGTTALHLALVALGIGKGDKVLVPSLTFIAVANAVTYTGARPIFVDSNSEYWCMDPTNIEGKIDIKTKAIIPVHLYGHPCNMGEIMRIAEDNDLHVIEDCAEAHGSEYKGRKVGSFGTISCYSFYGNKIITTGEGGMCLTNDKELADVMSTLRDHGMNPDKKYWHDIVGFNYRMTNLQAALGVAQIKKINLLIAKKRQVASTYKKLLQELPSVTPAPEMRWAKNVYWLYSVLVKKELRDRVIDHLGNEGIETRPFFYSIHTLPPYKRNFKYPVAERLSAMGLNLPSGSDLSDDQIEEVVAALKEVLK